MQPTTLSASSVQVYELCPARWNAEYPGRARQPAGNAAGIGTVDHGVLQQWVEAGFHKGPEPFSVMERLYEAEYYRLFTDASKYDDGKQMLRRWYDRNTDLGSVDIMSTEVKENFPLWLPGPLNQPRVEVPVNYIWDRCDRVPTATGYEVNIVDYKTISQPIAPDNLRRKIQARMYSLAARLKYPDAERIWVTFDLLRFEPVAIVFTKQEDKATWLYLQNVLRRILDDDGKTEKLNPDCRYCVRKLDCKAWKAHAAVGGSLGITDVNQAAIKRMELQGAIGALTAAAAELDEFIAEYCEKEEIFGFTVPDLAEVKITAKRTRDINTTTVVNIVGEEIAAEYGKIGVTAVDQMLKDSRLTSDQRSQLKQSFYNKWGEPKVKVEPLVVGLEDA